MNINKRINSKGETVYQIRVSLGYEGLKQITKSFTWKPDIKMTPNKAKKEAYRQGVLFEEKVKKEYQERIKDEKQGHCRDLKKITFRELAEEWFNLRAEVQLKYSSLLRMKDCTERVYASIGDELVATLKLSTIQSFIKSLSKEGTNKRTGGGLSPKTQKNYLSFISNVLEYGVIAYNRELINDNPCRYVKVPKGKPKQKVYSVDEVKTLLALVDKKAAENKSDLKYKVLFHILATTGLRKGEALGLEFKDIDFSTRNATIIRTSNARIGKGIYTESTKTKSSERRVHFTTEVIEMIKELNTLHKTQAKNFGDIWKETDRLFVQDDTRTTKTPGIPMHPNTPYVWLSKQCKAENIELKGIHAFRHFVATEAIHSGLDTKTVSAGLGHSQTSTTLNIYAHAFPDSNERMTNCIENLLK